jgi:hypothetical protein
MKRLTPLLIPLAVLVTGCGPSLKDVLAEHGPATRGQSAALTKVLENCQALAPLKQDTLPAKLQDVVFAHHHDRPGGNARTIWLEAKREPEKYLEPLDWSYLQRDDWWRTTAQALSDDPPSFSKKEIKALQKAFDALAGTKYVLVIKTIEYKAPRHLGGDRFFIGAMRGEAHLYRLADGEYLGGMTFEAFGQVIGYAGVDFTLDPKNPEASVRVLAARLYDNIHEYAEANLASRVAGVDSLYEIKKEPFQVPSIQRRGP